MTPIELGDVVEYGDMMLRIVAVCEAAEFIRLEQFPEHSAWDEHFPGWRDDVVLMMRADRPLNLREIREHDPDAFAHPDRGEDDRYDVAWMLPGELAAEED